MGVPLSSSWSSSKGMNAPSESLIEYAKRRMEMEPLIFHMMIFQWMTMFKILVNKNRPLFARWLLFLCKKATGDDQNKVKRPLYQGFANTLVLCISLSVLRDLHWLPLVISRFPSITIVYFTFPIWKPCCVRTDCDTNKWIQNKFSATYEYKNLKKLWFSRDTSPHHCS